MKAIPTLYRGTAFRSRLEASWAAHFDKRRLPWRYEPEAFTLSNGDNYLPDFYLPTARAWAEIKGDHGERVDKVEQFAADLWAESGAKETYDPNAPMVVMFTAPSPRPDPEDFWTGLTPLGVSGPGRGYSANFAHCRECGATTIVALWQTNCRNCGHVYESGFDAWFDPEWAYYVPFEYLRSTWRPAMPV